MSSEEPRPKSPRLANVERLRLVAMLEIVAFHVSEQRLPLVAGLGLPTFLLLNSAFNCTLSERMGTRPFLRVKVTRLLVPWLVWSLIYALVVLLQRLRHDEPLAEGFSAWMVVGGTYPHLWFVPFALFSGVFAALLRRATRERPAGGVVVASAAAGVVAVVVNAALLRAGTVEWPLLQWLFALPSSLLGFALGASLLAPTRAWLHGVIALAGLGVVACGVLLPWQTPPDMATRYAISLLLVGLSFIWPGRADPLSQRATPLLLGVYLSHPLVVRIYQATHWPEPPLALYALLVFAVSALIVVVLRRTPLKFLV
jgi:surface polysaccharide O-acyltransferase-like enzyme